jgi:hypothetical protein
MHHFFPRKVLLVSVFLALGPFPCVAQSNATSRGIWMAVGNQSLALSSLDREWFYLELAYQRGPANWELRVIRQGYFQNASSVRERAFLWGRWKAWGRKQGRFGLGVSWVCAEDRCGPATDPGVVATVCPHQDVIGFPFVGEASFSPVSFIALGAQVFGNVNSAQPYLGLALVLKAGHVQ